jgi:hypothetical protein
MVDATATGEVVGHLIEIQQPKGASDSKSVFVHMFKPDIARSLVRHQPCSVQHARIRSRPTLVFFHDEWCVDLVARVSRSSSSRPVFARTFDLPYEYEVRSVVAEYRRLRHATMRALEAAILLALSAPVAYYESMWSSSSYRHPHATVHRRQPDSYILLQCNPMRPNQATAGILAYYEWLEHVKLRFAEGRPGSGGRPTRRTVESDPTEIVVGGQVRACVYGAVVAHAREAVFYVRPLHHTIVSFYDHVESAFHMAVYVAPHRWGLALTALMTVVALQLRLPSILDVSPDAHLLELADADMCDMLERAIRAEYGEHAGGSPADLSTMSLRQIASVLGSRYTEMGETLVDHLRFIFDLDDYGDAHDFDFLVRMFEAKCVGDAPPDPMTCAVLFLLEKEVYDVSCVVNATQAASHGRSHVGASTATKRSPLAHRATRKTA